MRLVLGEIWQAPERDRLETSRDAGLVIDDAGRIAAVGPATELMRRHPDATISDHRGRLIVPGFIDTHTHFAQLDVIGSHGKQLLDWLKTYTYPAESRCVGNEARAQELARRFASELLRNGTTTAAVYGITCARATDALFQTCHAAGLRLIAGKVSMDRDAPEQLLQKAEDDLAQSEQLLAKWHGKDDRIFYALTPRFALACSDELMNGLAALKSRHPDLYVQTHHAENRAEIEAVARRFPKARSYAAVYAERGLLGERTILGHTVHPADDELALLAETKTKVAHCPTSNLFLGSGLFPARRLDEAGVAYALATDIGAGTTLSMWRTMLAAYEIQQLQGQTLAPTALFHLATLGGARVLGLASKTGSFAVGKDADYQVLDVERHPLLAARFAQDAAPEAKLFALITLADDRITREVAVRGRVVYQS